MANNLSEENQAAIAQAARTLGVSESAVLDMLVTTQLPKMVAAVTGQPGTRTAIDLVAIANDLPTVANYRIMTSELQPTDYWILNVAAQLKKSNRSVGELTKSLATVRARYWWDANWSTEISFVAKQEGITPEEMVLRLARAAKGDR